MTGRVQGVGFRATCAQRAAHLGLAGSVRNRPNGAVEVLAEGPATEVDALLDWCRTGPIYARVTSVDVTDEEPTGESGFRISG